MVKEKTVIKEKKSDVGADVVEGFSIDIDAKIAEEAFEASKQRWQGLSKTFLTKAPAKVMESIPLGIHLAKSAMEDVNLFRTVFTQEGFDFDQIFVFDQCVWGLWVAENRWNKIRKKFKKTNLDALLEEGILLRKELLEGSFYLWRNDEHVKSFLRDVKVGTGRWDLADDHQRLSDFLKSEWTFIKGRSEITLAMIKRSAAYAVELAEALQSTEYQKLQDLRLRAWNEFSFLYEEIRSAGLFVYRRNSEEASERYPSISKSRSSSPRPKATEPTTEPIKP